MTSGAATSPLYGGVEAGGTKFVVIIGTGPNDIIDEARFPTTTPDETLGRVVEFFTRPRPGVHLAALGVASFGPIDVEPSSPTYGYVTTTPKERWPNTNVVGRLREALEVPIGWDTDVNGAALGEQRWGAGQGIDPLFYITVGTGIGGGGIVNGAPMHGLMHPEMGHLLVPPFKEDRFPGICPFHGRCLEGVASGPALRARLGRPAEEMASDDPEWELEAMYIAYGLISIAEILSPKRIIVGGGVGSKEGLMPRIRQHVHALNAGYIAALESQAAVDAYIVPPGLGNQAGALGSLELARRALEKE